MRERIRTTRKSVGGGVIEDHGPGLGRKSCHVATPMPSRGGGAKVVGQTFNQATVAFRRNDADRPEKAGDGQNRQEPQADQRGRLDAAGAKIRMGGFQQIIESRHFLMQLSADAAYQQVGERRHRA